MFSSTMRGILRGMCARHERWVVALTDIPGSVFATVSGFVTNLSLATSFAASHTCSIYFNLCWPCAGHPPPPVASLGVDWMIWFVNARHRVANCCSMFSSSKTFYLRPPPLSGDRLEVRLALVSGGTPCVWCFYASSNAVLIYSCLSMFCSNDRSAPMVIHNITIRGCIDTQSTTIWSCTLQYLEHTQDGLSPRRRGTRKALPCRRSISLRETRRHIFRRRRR